jgi:hypothetical protein
VQSDVLIVDEVLAVGDLAFQRKCFDRMEQVIHRSGSTVLIVSHNLRQVERLCSRVLLLDHGKLAKDGPPTETCNEFYHRSDEKIARDLQQMAVGHGRFEKSADIDLLACDVLNEEEQPATSVQHRDDLLVRLRFRVHRPLTDVLFGVGFHTTDFVYLSTSQSLGQLPLAQLAAGTHELVCRFTQVPLLPGVYSIRAGVAFGGQVVPIFYGENLARFQITSQVLNRAWVSASNEGFFSIDTRWNLRSTEQLNEQRGPNESKYANAK